MSARQRELRQLERQMKALGWRVERTRGGHQKWIWKTAPPVFNSSTPSDHRSFDNLKAMLKRTMNEGASS